MLKKITQDSDFNEMMEFIKEEVISLMTAQQILKEEQEEILPIMKENYDGYKFLIDAKQRENCIALEGNIDKEQIIEKKVKIRRPFSRLFDYIFIYNFYLYEV